MKKLKFIAVFITAIFCLKTKAQGTPYPPYRPECQSNKMCYLMNNTDNANLWVKLDSIQMQLVINGGGGGVSLRQSTQDSIKKALYFSGSSSAITTVINNGNTILGNIQTNTSQLAQITVTPSFSVVSSTGSATLAAGFRFCSIANTGTAVATVNSFTINIGETISFPPIWNSLYNQITYNALTSTLHIIQSR